MVELLHYGLGGNDMKLIAHRGGKLGKENSLEAFLTVANMDGSSESLDKCLKMGADGVLMNDVQLALAWRSQTK